MRLHFGREGETGKGSEFVRLESTAMLIVGGSGNAVAARIPHPRSLLVGTLTAVFLLGAPRGGTGAGAGLEMPGPPNLALQLSTGQVGTGTEHAGPGRTDPASIANRSTGEKSLDRVGPDC